MELAVVFPGGDDPRKKIEWMMENSIFIIEMGPDFFLQNSDNIIINSVNSLRKYGINIRSVHAPFGGDFNLSNPKLENRKMAVQTHLEILRKLGIGDIEIMVIHPGVGGNHNKEDLEKMNKLAIESIFQLMDAAKSAKVKLALENMLPGHPGYEIRQILDAIEQINSPFLRVCFDSGHAHVCGNMREFMEAVGKHIIHIHMQDNDGTRDLHIQPPYGTTDWQAFVEVLKKINYQEPITLEVGPWGGASYRQMFKEVSSLLESLYYNLSPPEIWQGSKDNLTYRCRKCGHFVFKKGNDLFCNCRN